MAAEYEEVQDYFQRIPLLILDGCLIATDVFIVICYLMDWVKELWEPAVWIALSIAAMVFAQFYKLRITLGDGAITVRTIRTRVYAYERIIDAKKGDIDIMRDYSGWGRGKVKFRTYAVPGIEDAVSVKLAGREVLTVTTVNVDELYDLIISHRRED
ncbi:hypothetical protein TALC_01055 [Thermoplasmatales archaeon BRNA1]|nr:hypothetical protein TALC_01055 [Thermoplasmatales archaeon BRNA1]